MPAIRKSSRKGSGKAGTNQTRTEEVPSTSQKIVTRTTSEEVPPTSHPVARSTPVSETSHTVASSSFNMTIEDALMRLAKGIDPKLPPLPTFDGDLDEWDGFHKAYMESTKIKDIPDHENMARLRKALTGIALDPVKEYLNRPSCLPLVMEELELQFGPQASLFDNLSARCDAVPEIEKGRKNFPQFTLAVKSLRRTFEKANVRELEEMFLEKIEIKLDYQALLDWASVKVKETPVTYHSFVKWLTGYRTLLRAVGAERPTRYPDQQKKGNKRIKEEDCAENEHRKEDWGYNMTSRSSRRDYGPTQRRSLTDTAHVDKVMSVQVAAVDYCDMECTEMHKLGECPKFKSLNYEAALEHLRKAGRCFTLKCYGKHMARYCPNRR